VQQAPHLPVLGTSGDPDLRRVALAAGAAAFVPKPLPPPAAFAALVARVVPPRQALPAGLPAPDPAAPLPAPDPLALREDLARAARMLEGTPDAPTRAYLACFLSGLARGGADPVLERAAQALGSAGPSGGNTGGNAGGGNAAVSAGALRALLADRLTGAPDAFARR
jgi:hypothetical protein